MASGTTNAARQDETLKSMRGASPMRCTDLPCVGVYVAGWVIFVFVTFLGLQAPFLLGTAGCGMSGGQSCQALCLP